VEPAEARCPGIADAGQCEIKVLWKRSFLLRIEIGGIAKTDIKYLHILPDPVVLKTG
jgi:hypothetical protein